MGITIGTELWIQASGSEHDGHIATVEHINTWQRIVPKDGMGITYTLSISNGKELELDGPSMAKHLEANQLIILEAE